MKVSFCILTILGLLFCGNRASCFKAHDNEVATDSSTISRDYLDIVESADSIVWYLLDPMSEDSTALQKNKMGEILLCKTDTLEVGCPI